MALGPNEHERNIAFSSALKMALQQDDSRLFQYSTTLSDVDTVEGNAFDEMAPFGRPDTVTSPHSYNPIEIKQLMFTRRWLRSKIWTDTRHWPSFTDTVRLTDPTSDVIKYFVASFNRERDLYWIDQYFGSTLRGMSAPGGDPDATFLPGQTIAVDVLAPGTTPAATGLNRFKINAAFTLFLRNEATRYAGNGPQCLHIAASATQFLNLLNDDNLNDRMSILGQFTSQGWINYLGIMFHHSELLPLTTVGAHRRCPVWMADGMKIKVAKDTDTRLVQRDDIELHPWQASVNMKIAAARADEKMCAEIICDE